MDVTAEELEVLTKEAWTMVEIPQYIKEVAPNFQLNSFFRYPDDEREKKVYTGILIGKIKPLGGLRYARTFEFSEDFIEVLEPGDIIAALRSVLQQYVDQAEVAIKAKIAESEEEKHVNSTETAP